ncbi:MAG: alpha/beta hydrolase [Gammaproteobacteria bacterium]|nr:alpha/beta hydrolase [Gammaproteobacteria bacterium]
MKTSFLMAILFLFYGGFSVAFDYGYPIKNPLSATIMGTPEGLEASQESLQFWQPDYVDIASPNSQFDKKIASEKKITIFPDRKISDVFWYEKGGMEYSIAKHDAQAPLIFIIAGTGSSYRSSIARAQQKIFYQAGFHVVTLSSPTVPNFMLNASKLAMPGNMNEDSRDLHNAMQLVMKKHNDVQVSDYYLTGYSLGASNVAYVTKFDDETQGKAFHFKKVLLINPPLSLVNSVNLLDNMFIDNIPGGLNKFNDFYQKLIHRVSDFHHKNEDLGLGRDFFYAMFKEQPPSDEEMKALIGFVFRIASSGMVFAADVFNHHGYIVPKDKVDTLTPSTSLTAYSKVSFRLGFGDYIKNFYLPKFEEDLGISRNRLLTESSLESIASYLQNNDRISVMLNADDPILMPGELDQFSVLFPGRVTIYPHGGHLGNILYHQHVYDMLAYFTGKQRQSSTSTFNKGAVK